MKETCRLAANTLDYIETKLEIGMSTEDINTLVHEYIIKHDAIPSPLNYHGFPKSVCTSLNDVICHGIPNKKDVLRDGDILNIDVTTYFKKYHGDTNRTFLIGNVSEENKKLVETTYKCMMAGINEIKPGGRLGSVGAAIQEIAEAEGYSVVKDFCGHGIGREFHEEPQVVHYGQWDTGLELVEGMVFTVEPMINLGSYKCRVLDDGWTAKTIDGKNSAQFEHTCYVTDNGVEILTLSKKERESLNL